MNSWIKIGIPLLIAVLLITASVGITLAVSGSSAAQAASTSYQPRQVSDTQYARGPLCSGCPGLGQGTGTADPDDVYVPGGATCPNCPGYRQGSVGNGTTTYRGGCCGR